MSMNSSAVQLPVIPQQPQDTGLHPALQPGTPDVADLSEPGNTEPVLNNRAATNSSTLVTEDVNQLPISIDNHTAPEKSDRSSSASSEAVSPHNLPQEHSVDENSSHAPSKSADQLIEF